MCPAAIKKLNTGQLILDKLWDYVLYKKTNKTEDKLYKLNQNM